MLRLPTLSTALCPLLVAGVVSALPARVPASAAPTPSGWRVGSSGHTGGRWVTLVTGDRVYQDGDRVAVTPGAGRESVGFSQYTRDGHEYVVPDDALRLVAAGQVDRRLFDVTGLVAAGDDDGHTGDISAIVAYRTGLDTPLAADGASRVTRSLPSVQGSAVRVSKSRTTSFWARVTAKGSTIGKLWLDGKRSVSLDQSVPQIGAPQAWAAGYDGTGVTVAILDTGVDDTHPDLAGRIAGEVNFTDAPDTRDTVGHGTHVASTIAGSGAASDGRYKGVAPGARLLIGKVCATDQCDDSAILAGMQWAASRAKVINVSLGGPDVGDDPLKTAVNTLTAQTGTLFVVAAGNEGTDGGVSSPATADAALAVGAVDKQDNLASFSNRGPRADGAIKPDITAPGVGIVAALSKDSGYPQYTPGYTELSGTSMAAPHVAGSAAIMAQQHPNWAAPQLKAELMASAKPNPALSVFAQGAGRVDVGRAIHQAVLPSPTSLALGTQPYPSVGDVPVTRTVTYHNDGPAALTLNLTTAVTAPDGTAAPAGMFTARPGQVTVPAGGSVDVTLTADTRLPSATGVFSGALMANSVGDTVSVRVPLTITKSHELRNLTVKVLDRNGAPATNYELEVAGVDFPVFTAPYDASGTLTASLRVGRYHVEATVITGASGTGSSTLLVQPTFTLASGSDAQIVLDARKGTPASVTVPRATAAAYQSDLGFHRTLPSGYTLDNRIVGSGLDTLYAANLGGSVSAGAGTLTGEVRTVWAQRNGAGTFDNSPYEYDLVWFRQGTLFTNFRHVVRDRELATVVNRYYAVSPGTYMGYGHNWGFPIGGGSALSRPVSVAVPGQHIVYATTGGVSWQTGWDQQGPADGTQLSSAQAVYQAGRRYTVDWQRAPSAPIFNGDGVFFTRQGNYMSLNVPPFGDQDGHTGYSTVDNGRMTLYQDARVLTDLPTAFYGASGDVDATQHAYRLEYSTTRGTDGDFDNSTTMNGAWTFRSGQTRTDKPTAMPLASVAFRPQVDTTNSAAGGYLYRLPLSVQRQPGAAAAELTQIAVQVSYDQGATWRPVFLLPTGSGAWVALLDQPRQGYVSLRASGAYSDGATVEYTVLRAYRLRPR